MKQQSAVTLNTSVVELDVTDDSDVLDDSKIDESVESVLLEDFKVDESGVVDDSKADESGVVDDSKADESGVVDESVILGNPEVLDKSPMLIPSEELIPSQG